MIYADSNVFIYAILYRDEKAERARKLVKAIRLGKMDIATSYLTFDEVFWIVKRELGVDEALKAGKAFLQMPNLRFVDVDARITKKAYELIDTYRLAPRDAIHAASALEVGKEIISNDKDFDRIKELRRKAY